MLVFDDITFDRIASYQLAAQELACSLTSVVFAGDDTPYYAVGTAIVKPEEYEPQKGRLLLLAYRWGEDGPGAGGREATGRRVAWSVPVAGSLPWPKWGLPPSSIPQGGRSAGGGGGQGGQGRLRFVDGRPLRYAMQPFQGRLLATVNSKVHVFKWVPAGGGGGGGGVGGGAAELVSETSTPVQVLSLFLAAR